jgi:hypothetical protein
MKKRAAAVLAATSLGLAACVGDASQGSACRTTEDTLARLRDGMNYQQVTQAIGCAGTIDSNTTANGGQIMVARWSGPGASAFSATLVTFRNDRMIAFGVNGQ